MTIPMGDTHISCRMGRFSKLHCMILVQAKESVLCFLTKRRELIAQ